jgi:hypothetical protein
MNLDTKTRKHDICAMKNVTITLPDDLAHKARVEAAKQDKSLSRFVADLLAECCHRKPSREEALAVLKEFWNGPGFPGVSKNWRGREAHYAEREDELLRRYESSRLRPGSDGERKAGFSEGDSGTDYQPPHAGSESAKPQRVLSGHNRKARPRGKK